MYDLYNLSTCTCLNIHVYDFDMYIQNDLVLYPVLYRYIEPRDRPASQTVVPLIPTETAVMISSISR